jgi:aminoglycoside 3-N-acetyltransferase I
MDVQTLKLKASDADKFAQLIDLYEDVFEMEDFRKPPAEYLRRLLENDALIVFVALAGETVIGGLTAHALPSVYFQAAEIYVYDLAVKREFQRRGVGTKLMASVRKYGAETGMKELFIEAEKSDAHAVDFYKKIGGAPLAVVHFSFPPEKD